MTVLVVGGTDGVGLSLVTLSFLAYSVLGWVLEGTVRCLVERRLVNTGLLAGPYVPIYGIGALCILAATATVRDRPVLVFVIGVVVATVVEFVGHLLLQRLLGLVLWDYSERFGNLQGRVCLGNSVGFGIAALGAVYLIDPLLTAACAALDPLVAVALASALSVVFALDGVRSIAAVVRLRPDIQAIGGSLARVRGRVEAQLSDLGAGYDRRRARVLKRSRRILAQLESAFPSARAVRISALGRDRQPGGPPYPVPRLTTEESPAAPRGGGEDVARGRAAGTTRS